MYPMTSAVLLPLVLLGAYVAGSINFSIILFRLLGRRDPRTRYSGNAGVTNVYRQAGLPLAALVLTLDVGRAMAAALLAERLGGASLAPWAGLALILGSHFSCFHGWPCGKGVANYLGFYALLLPLGVSLALAVYLIIFLLTRISFLGSCGIVATLTAFGCARWIHEPFALVAVLITSGSILWFHRGNVALLLHRKGVR
jgi:glycerol-3-phosphate acyltransferase PlsY